MPVNDDFASPDSANEPNESQSGDAGRILLVFVIKELLDERLQCTYTPAQGCTPVVLRYV